MVKICSTEYPNENEIKYNNYFEKYSFPLSSFQKYAIEGIVEGNHVLITAHTGSGKTLPAEFAIEYFVNNGKKVIYTSPIKALSNQKYYEFTNKYPNISFGILTGDIKSNPEADVLIMTTEILLNTLYNKQNNSDNLLLLFDMDFENELSCVIFDEVHYVNDKERGRIWEETIMLLPKHIQMVMLSATIDTPEKFAYWCETKGSNLDNKTNNKIVYLSSTNNRIVPLTHYSFITTNNSIFKIIKDKEIQKQIKDIINKPFVIQDSNGLFNETHYHKMRKMIELFENKRVFVKRTHILNEICKYMKENNMLPALCFVLSRKQLEVCANEINVPLLEDDSKVPYIIKKECEQIIRKLPNYNEYLNLPEYLQMVALLEKGIALHHSGVIPVFKEIVELMYSKGYIKLLFATETFAIGVNMPTKTVIFTDVNKFDGNNLRHLYSHEYTQMAGRAGRRGLDKVGHVIHLNNLFRNIDCVGYKQILQGKPQKLVSKFKISYNLILNLISTKNYNFNEYIGCSMIQENLYNEKQELSKKINDLTNKTNNLEIIIKSPKDVLEEYYELKNNICNKKNKERILYQKRLTYIKEQYFHIDNDYKILEKYKIDKHELDNLNKDYYYINNYLNHNIENVLKLLNDEKFIEYENEEYTLTYKGIISTQIHETHSLAFSNIIEKKIINKLTSRQLVGLFSCFTNISVNDELKYNNIICNDNITKEVIKDISNMYSYYSKKEEEYNIDSGIDYNIQYDLIDTALKWCDCNNIEDCKYILQYLEKEKGIFLGEFVKALLKIINISSELEQIAYKYNEIELLSNLRNIPNIILKYVVTNQSLYI